MSDKCNHKGQWRIAGPANINNLPMELLMGATIFCRNCGEVKTKLSKMKLTPPPKNPVVKPVPAGMAGMPVPIGIPIIKKGLKN